MNIYKKTITAAAIISVALIAVSDHTSNAKGNVAGAPVGKTGSPGDASNCTACHAGTAVAGGSIASDVPVTGYIPGTTYSITATITSSGISRFGFEVSPQNSTGVQKGILIVTNATETKLVGTTAKYITHKSAGTSGVGSKTWTFNWTAPVAGSGDVTMYGAFIAANSNNANTGDQVFLSNLLIQESLSSGIEGLDDLSAIVLYPNPATSRLFIKTLTSSENIQQIWITDITGKLIKNIKYENFSEDAGIDIAGLPGGLYVLNIVSKNGTYNKKFIKN